MHSSSLKWKKKYRNNTINFSSSRRTATDASKVKMRMKWNESYVKSVTLKQQTANMHDAFALK